ncbi:MAG: hypothetical protein RL247_820 [Actinomycetota bacterium]
MKANWAVQAPADVLDKVVFSSDGLVPCIAQDSQSHKVLMMAWMNREALERTLIEGRVTYYSRSRQELWRKGDTSGNTQHAHSLSLDCDGDVVLVQVTQMGPACHTGQESCFEAPGG